MRRLKKPFQYRYTGSLRGAQRVLEELFYEGIIPTTAHEYMIPERIEEIGADGRSYRCEDGRRKRRVAFQNVGGKGGKQVVVKLVSVISEISEQKHWDDLINPEESVRWVGLTAEVTECGETKEFIRDDNRRLGNLWSEMQRTAGVGGGR